MTKPKNTYVFTKQNYCKFCISYDGTPATAPEVSYTLFNGQINMAAASTRLRHRSDQRAFIFIHALHATPDFKQQERRKQYSKLNGAKMNTGTMNTRKRLQRQRYCLPSDRQGLSRNARPNEAHQCNIAPTIPGQDSLPTTGWLAECCMPARLLYTLFLCIP